MAPTKLEARIDELETRFSQRIEELGAKVSQLSQQVAPSASSGDVPWWQTVAGVYKDNPDFDEVVRLGYEYREAQRRTDTEAGN